MAGLELFLLGSPRIKIDDQPVDIRRTKAQALLYYLAMKKGPQRRDILATLLWPDSTQSLARSSLRRELSILNKALGKSRLLIERETIGLHPETWLDVNQFTQLLAEAPSDNPLDQDHLSQAVRLYRDDFLMGFSLTDCPEYDEWQFFQAEGLRQQLASALASLIDVLQNKRLFEEAIVHARRYVNLDPLHEDSQRQLMILYAKAGQRAAALRQYQLCLDTLAKELGISPSQETTTLYQQIRRGRFSNAEAKPEPVLDGQPAVSTDPGSAKPGLIHKSTEQNELSHNLPLQTTPFLGRETELADLAALLQDPVGRLVSIIGPGGMGKTRLALAAAEAELESPNFSHGVFFIPLAPLSHARQMVSAIADALDYPLETAEPESQYGKAQLLKYLEDRRLLLVLDNFEHLLDGIEIVADILQTASGVRILVTSRERLYLHEEQLFPLAGLSFPVPTSQMVKVEASESLEDALAFPAIKLFRQSAKRVQPQFEFSAVDIKHVTRICSLLEGMPLGIELAAAWVDLMPLSEISREIESNLDFLETEVRNVPDRQRSIRAVFDSTWGRMAESEQVIFSQLSIFQGGFTRSAALGVAGASLRPLSILLSKSLLRYDKETDRYQVHELLRQYAAEKLSQAGRTQLARDEHSNYFAGFLNEQASRLKSHRVIQARSDIEADFENVRQAWSWALERKAYDAIDRALEGLYWFHNDDLRHIQDGQSLFAQGREILRPEANEASHPVWGKVLARVLPYGSEVFNEPHQAATWLEQALTIAEAQNDDAEVAFCHLNLARIKLDLWEAPSAITALEAALDYYRRVDDRFYIAWVLKTLGKALQQLRQFRQALGPQQESLSLFEDLGTSQHPILFDLAMTLARLSDYEGAEGYLQRACELSRAEDKPSDLAGALTFRGALFFEQGQPERAQEYISEALKIADDNYLEWRQIHASLYLGMIATIQGEYELAVEYMQRVQYRSPTTYWSDKYAQVWLGLALFGLGDYDLARRQLLLRLELLNRPARSTDFAYDGLVLAAMLYDQAGQAQTATRLLALAFQAARPGSPSAWIGKYALTLNLKETLAARLPVAVFDTSWTEGQRLKLEDVFEDMIKDISAANWPAHPDGLIGRREALSKSSTASSDPVDTASGEPDEESVERRANLPLQATPFVGRDTELAELAELLADSNVRLITILGPGGMGKTRLAIEAGRQYLAYGQTEAHFVALAQFKSPEDLATAAAKATDYPFQQDGRSMGQQVLDYLREKAMLLVLDNFEHMLSAADFVNEILLTAPQVKVLITSRERLRLSAETVFSLSGMDYPPPDGSADVMAFNAARLFLQSARRIRPDYDLTSDDASHIGRICHLVQGMPLGIMLAAAWCDTLSFQEIGDEINQNLDFLETELRDVPERQRSIRAVFSYAWERLGENERQVFMRLSLFRGGASREAAQVVAKASLRDLNALIAKSLLRRNTDGRYEVHELLRQYAEAELEGSGQFDALCAEYSAYYLSFLEEREQDIKGQRQVEGLDEVEQEFENLRLAWEYAVAHRHYDQLDRALEGLYWFCVLRNRHHDVEPLLTLAREQTVQVAAAKAHRLAYRLGAYVLINRGFYRRLNSEAIAQFRESVAAAQLQADEPAMAFAFWRLAFALYGSEQQVEAIECYKKSLQHYQTLEDEFYQAQVLRDLATQYNRLGRPDAFKDAIELSLNLRRKIGDLSGATHALGQLVGLALGEGDKHKMMAYLLEQQDLRRRMRDRRGIALGLGHLSFFEIYFNGNLKQAQTLAQQALDISTALNAPIASGRALNRLSLVACFEEDAELALSFFERYIRASTNVKDDVPLNQAFVACSLKDDQWLKLTLAQVFSQQVLKDHLQRLCLGPLAFFLSRTGLFEKAVEVLSLALHHPLNPKDKGWFADWPPLKRLRRELESSLSPDVFRRAWERGQDRNLDVLIKELQDVLGDEQG